MKDPELLNTALEQFLGKGEKEIIDTIIQTVEGHLRSILGKFPSVRMFILVLYCLMTLTHYHTYVDYSTWYRK